MSPIGRAMTVFQSRATGESVPIADRNRAHSFLLAVESSRSGVPLQGHCEDTALMVSSATCLSEDTPRTLFYTTPLTTTTHVSPQQ